jgi:hypothetical protein
MKRPVQISPAAAITVAKVASALPMPKRRQFLKGLAIGLKGLSRADDDQVATAVVVQLRLHGIVPELASKKAAGRSPFGRLAA